MYNSQEWQENAAYRIPKALGFVHKDIECIARTSADSVMCYLKDYNEAGLVGLGMSRSHCPVRNAYEKKWLPTKPGQHVVSTS